MGSSLAVQWLRLGASTVTARVQSLVRELRSHKPSCAAKKKRDSRTKSSPSPYLLEERVGLNIYIYIFLIDEHYWGNRFSP